MGRVSREKQAERDSGMPSRRARRLQALSQTEPSIYERACERTIEALDAITRSLRLAAAVAGILVLPSSLGVKFQVIPSDPDPIANSDHDDNGVRLAFNDYNIISSSDSEVATDAYPPPLLTSEIEIQIVAPRETSPTAITADSRGSLGMLFLALLGKEFTATPQPGGTMIPTSSSTSTVAFTRGEIATRKDDHEE